MDLKASCNLLKFPRECHCQRIHHLPIFSLNETRLRCRQLTEITTNYPWSTIPYDRLIFETSNDNLTLHRFVFTDIIVRTLRFNVQNLFLNYHTFHNAYIGQLGISYQDTYGRINFQLNNQIFYDTIITNLYFKSIDFQKPISELIFSNTKIYKFLIQSSKFYGFINKKIEIIFKPITKIKYDYFLEYEYLLSTNSKKIPHQLIDENPKQTLTMNITSINYPIYITIYTIISSINTTNLTENYFPNNLEYNQLEEIELSYNKINSLNAHVFRHLKEFKGRLILSNNEIKYLNLYALTDLVLLKNLSLTKNFIQNLSSIHFEKLNHLYELDLSFNYIYQLNNNIFEYLYNLHILYLNNNPLEFIHSNAFSNLTKLKQIHFQGVQFIHLIDQQYFQWIWNLADLHVIHLLKTDFDLSDVAFCILSRYNQTLFHLSHQHSCSCNIHYFNHNQNFNENTSISISKYNRNYLRLTPICKLNDTESIFEQQINENDLILQGLEDKCDYKLIFLDCDAMTTTTTQITPSLKIKTDNKYNSNIRIRSTTKSPVPPTSGRNRDTHSRKNPLNNIKKLLTVLGTLIAITIGAIILVFFWYRFKSTIKPKKTKKNFAEQQRHFNSPVTNNNHSTAPRYASLDMLSSIHSAYLSASKSQSEPLIEPSVSQLSTIDKNIQAIDNDHIENFIDDENLQKNSIETQATTQC